MLWDLGARQGEHFVSSTLIVLQCCCCVREVLNCLLWLYFLHFCLGFTILCWRFFFLSPSWLSLVLLFWLGRSRSTGVVPSWIWSMGRGHIIEITFPLLKKGKGFVVLMVQLQAISAIFFVISLKFSWVYWGEVNCVLYVLSVSVLLKFPWRLTGNFVMNAAFFLEWELRTRSVLELVGVFIRKSYLGFVSKDFNEATLVFDFCFVHVGDSIRSSLILPWVSVIVTDERVCLFFSFFFKTILFDCSFPFSFRMSSWLRSLKTTLVSSSLWLASSPEEQR